MVILVADHVVDVERNQGNRILQHQTKDEVVRVDDTDGDDGDDDSDSMEIQPGTALFIHSAVGRRFSLRNLGQSRRVQNCLRLERHDLFFQDTNVIIESRCCCMES